MKNSKHMGRSGKKEETLSLDRRSQEHARRKTCVTEREEVRIERNHKRQCRQNDFCQAVMKNETLHGEVTVIDVYQG